MNFFSDADLQIIWAIFIIGLLVVAIGGAIIGVTADWIKQMYQKLRGK